MNLPSHSECRNTQPTLTLLSHLCAVWNLTYPMVMKCFSELSERVHYALLPPSSNSIPRPEFQRFVAGRPSKERSQCPSAAEVEVMAV